MHARCVLFSHRNISSLAMLAFAGMIMAGQVTGKGPLANLGEHLASPMTTNMFAKAIVSPAGGAQLHCAIPAITSFQGLEIRAFPPTPAACARFPLLALSSRCLHSLPGLY